MVSDQAIKNIKDIESLLDFLRDKLDWPIEDEEMETLTFEYYPDELGLDAQYENMISSIRQLRPLADNQPWGIFFLDFKKKSLPVGALRKILSGLVFSKRRNTEHAVWDKSELIFICSLKYEDNLVIGFVHFKDSNSTVPSINTVYWDVNKETNFNFKSRLENLVWPSDMSKTEEWKRNWSSAFTTVYRENIVQSRQVVEQLAKLAQNTRQRVLETYFVENAHGELRKLYKKFQELLIHDLSITDFADMYAQTVAYGLFSARCMDTDGHFELSEVVDRIPTTNPFLKQLLTNCFEHGLGSSSSLMFDELAIGEIVDLLDHIDTDKILDDFGRQTGGGSEDPVIHFYEGFLDAYEHEQKKRRGVYYTPDPVVSFIIRSVDEILREEFGYADGLADISTKTIEYQRESKRQKKGTQTKYVVDTKEVPAIQILDPATGTGTFLAHTIRQIKANFDHKHQGKSVGEIQELWNEYVPEHLLPRLNGFEIMMAPYSVAHMKLGLVLKETGYDFHEQDRLNIYLTNSLEGAGSEEITLFDLLSNEAAGANKIKNNNGINVVIGNPPYSVSSSNKNKWIESLIADYKKNLNERKINLDDDYIKFIRFGQHFIDENRKGILVYISNNSFIDGITHRQMRKQLLESFNKVYILDLHGDAKKKEVCDDGSVDQNVFDIMQGVSINILIKTEKNNELGKVFHFDLQGKREFKYDKLNRNTYKSIEWNSVKYTEPYFFFVPKDFSAEKNYNSGFKITDLFVTYSSGIETKNDRLTIKIRKNELEHVINDFKELDVEELKKQYSLKDTSGWTVKKAQEDLLANEGSYHKIYYRPFDIRNIYMTEKSGGFVGRPRLRSMRHFFYEENIGLITVRQQSTFDFQHILVSNTIMERCGISLQTRECGYIFPLYLYPEKSRQNDILDVSEKRTPNLNIQLTKHIAESLGLRFTNEKEKTDGTIAPIDILDYIYAVLHSPTYRDKYKELLKIDFPRVPYPEEDSTFWELVKIGEELRQIHLLESPLIENSLSTYPIAGTNEVVKISYQDEKVWINQEQYFGNVPRLAWEYYIGGYQPAQKWLKDRKGRTLNNDDVKYYLRIIAVLLETDRLMKKIDQITDF